jgi:16S rRNA processing protein RimM
VSRTKNQPASSPRKLSPSGSDVSQSGPDFLIIGQIIKPHGVKGEVVVKVLTDFPDRFEKMKTVYLGNATSQQLYQVKSTRWHQNMVLVSFVSVPERNAAEELRDLYLKIPAAEARTLEPDAYYHHQLVGLTVITDAGETLGRLTEILETGANDVYVVASERGEILLPATREVVQTVDLAAGQMIIHPLEGLY